MARPQPALPHQTVHVVETDRRASTDWYLYFSQLKQRVPVSGSVTFATATTAIVTLAIPETTTDYTVVVEPPEDRRVWITAKTVTGFTINVSAASSATYQWLLFRR